MPSTLSSTSSMTTDQLPKKLIHNGATTTTVDWLFSLLTRIKSTTNAYTLELERLVQDYVDNKWEQLEHSGLEEEDQIQNQTIRFQLSKEIITKFQNLTTQTEESLHDLVFETTVKELQDQFLLVKRPEQQKNNILEREKEEHDGPPVNGNEVESHAVQQGDDDNDEDLVGDLPNLPTHLIPAIFSPSSSPIPTNDSNDEFRGSSHKRSAISISGEPFNYEVPDANDKRSKTSNGLYRDFNFDDADDGDITQIQASQLKVQKDGRNNNDHIITLDDYDYDSDVEVISEMVKGGARLFSKNQFNSQYNNNDQSTSSSSSSSNKTVIVSNNCYSSIPRPLTADDGQRPGFSGSFYGSEFNKKRGSQAPNQNTLTDDKPLLLFNSDSSTCNFCAKVLDPNVGIIAQACQHLFCSECLENRVENSSGSQVACPLDCGQFLYVREIKALLAPSKPKVDTRTQQKGVEKLPVFRCKTSGCSGVCLMDDKEGRIFLCQICNKQNCVECNACHDDVSCQIFKNLRQEADKSGNGANISNEELLEKAGLAENFAAKEMEKLFGGLLPDMPKDNLSLYYDAASKVMENLKVVTTHAEFECLICSRMNSEVPRGGVILTQCTHNFCIECIEEVIKNAETLPVPCPYIDSDSGPCKEFLTSAEFKALASQEVYDKHMRWGWSIAQDVIEKKFHCLARDCVGFWEIEDDTPNGSYPCPVCQQVNCVHCNAIHPDSTCAEYQEVLRREMSLQEAGLTAEELEHRRTQIRNEVASEAEVNRMLTAKQFYRCPACRFVCEKISGCSQVRCLNRACGQAFTWLGGLNPTSYMPPLPPLPQPFRPLIPARFLAPPLHQPFRPPIPAGFPAPPPRIPPPVTPRPRKPRVPREPKAPKAPKAPKEPRQPRSRKLTVAAPLPPSPVPPAPVPPPPISLIRPPVFTAAAAAGQNLIPHSGQPGSNGIRLPGPNEQLHIRTIPTAHQSSSLPYFEGTSYTDPNPFRLQTNVAPDQNNNNHHSWSPITRDWGSSSSTSHHLPPSSSPHVAMGILDHSYSWPPTTTAAAAPPPPPPQAHLQTRSPFGQQSDHQFTFQQFGPPEPNFSTLDQYTPPVAHSNLQQQQQQQQQQPAWKLFVSNDTSGHVTQQSDPGPSRHPLRHDGNNNGRWHPYAVPDSYRPWHIPMPRQQQQQQQEQNLSLDAFGSQNLAPAMDDRVEENLASLIDLDSNPSSPSSLFSSFADQM